MNSPMKIAVGAFSFTDGVTQKQCDGIGTQTKQLIKQLQLKGQQVTAVASANYRPQVYLSRYCSFTQFAKLDGQFDVYHVTDYLIPKLKRTPIVATLHDAIFLKEAAVDHSRFRKLKNYLMCSHAKYASRVITVSHAIKKDIVEHWHIDGNKIDVIPPCTDDKWFATAQDFSLVPNAPYVLMVGTLQQRKNFSRVIKAFKQLPKHLRHCRLLIVGNKGSRYAEVWDDVQGLITSGRGSYLQYVSFEQLKALYQRALCLCFPSLSEGFGIPVMEAYASKTPVITSNIPVLKEVAAGFADLVDPYSIDDIKDKLVHRMEAELQACSDRSAALQCAKANCWVNLIDDYIACYQRTIA